MNFICVCEKCNRHVQKEDGAVIEFNFHLKSIMFVCPFCKKNNEINMRPVVNALPRTRISR